MEGKDVILLMGSPGSGKTTTMHYLAGTSFREITREGINYFKPVEVSDTELANMKVSCGGKEVITRHLQVVSVPVDGGSVVLCDSPSFGDHETIEEVIANSLGLVRAIQKAKSVRPVLVLSRDEIGFRDQFNAYPQILSILVRMLGTDSNVNLEPFNFVFTKYDTKDPNCLRKQFSMFLKDGIAGSNKNEANKQAIIKHLLENTNPDSNIIVPTKGNPMDFLRKLMANQSSVGNPESFFVPNLSDAILAIMKRQLKFTLLDLRDALSKNDNSTGIHRMQQMSKLANLLPEAGIYARHGFKAFKEIINQMVEDDDDESYYDDNSIESSTSHEELKFSDSKESWASGESEQWSNLSSKIRKSGSNDLLVSRHLSTVPEETDSDELEKESEREREIVRNVEPRVPEGGTTVPISPSPNLVHLATQSERQQAREEECFSPESDESSEFPLSEDFSSEDEDETESEVIPSEILPEEEQVYAEQYSGLLKEMTIRAVEQEDYLLAVQRMQEFMRLAKQSPEHVVENPRFQRCVELFLRFSVALKECDYHQCLAQLDELIRMGEAGVMEAKKCSECGVKAAIKHIVDLRERVIAMTSQLHTIDDPDEFDRMSERLRVLRRNVEGSNMLMEACMRGSNDEGKSETVLACISYGFKVGRLSR